MEEDKKTSYDFTNHNGNLISERVEWYEGLY